jgi:hypothetical protein
MLRRELTVLEHTDATGTGLKDAFLRQTRICIKRTINRERARKPCRA